MTRAYQEDLEQEWENGEDLPAAGITPETARTSKAAAMAMAPDAATLREMVFQAITRSGLRGRTDDELQQMLRLSGNTERPRRWELFRDGRIKPSGKTRKNRRGRDCVVWVLDMDGEGYRTECCPTCHRPFHVTGKAAMKPLIPTIHVTRENSLCMLKKPCPRKGRLVVGRIRWWKDKRGYQRRLWCARCTATGERSVNLELDR